MKKWLTILIVAALAAVGVWLVRPAYRSYKEKRFAAQAEEAMRKGELRKAMLTARQVLVINPNNLAACRVMADLADSGRSPHALMWRQKIAELEPTPTNLLLLASCALRYEAPPFPVASQALAGLKGQDDFVPYHVVSAQLALKQNRVADAEKHFDAAIRLEPNNGLHQLNRATVRLQSRDPAVSAQAHEQLVALQTNATVGEFAMRALAQFHAGRRQFDEAVQYSTALLKHERATFDDRLDNLMLLREAKRPEFQTAAAELRSQAATNALQTFAVASRLIAAGEAVAALQWLKSLPAEMQNEQPVPLAIADAYAALKEWQSLEQYLNGQRWKEQEFARLALLSFAVRNQGDDNVSRVHWEQAVKAAGDRPDALRTLAQMSGGWKWNAEAEALLWRVARDFPNERWAVDALHNSYARERNTRKLHSIYALLLQRHATNAVVQNNFASISLLLNTNMAQAHKFAGDVYQTDTNNFGFISTYAWSLHLQGRTSEALRLMERIDPQRLNDPALSGYYGALLVAAGQSAKAKDYLTRAESAEILPEEKAIVAEAKKKL